MVYMQRRPRLYDSMLKEHLAQYRQMAFLTGPLQVGKTTTCRALGDTYLNWDNEDHRALILRGPSAVAAETGLERLPERLKHPGLMHRSSPLSLSEQFKGKT